MRNKHNGTTRVHTCIDIELNFTRRNPTTKNKTRSYLIQYRSQFLRKFRKKKKKDRVIVERITIPSKSFNANRNPSLQFPCRRFSLSLRLTGETASWPLGEKRKYRGTRKEERGKKKRKEERKKIKKRAVERRIYFHGV